MSKIGGKPSRFCKTIPKPKKTPAIQQKPLPAHMAVWLVSALIPIKTGKKWKSVPIRDALPKICQPTLHLNGDLLSWQLDEQAAKL